MITFSLDILSQNSKLEGVETDATFRPKYL
jgi:hypothetical protein